MLQIHPQRPHIAKRKDSFKPSTERLTLVLNRPTFVICWWSLVLVHFLELTFLVATARLYDWIFHDPFAPLYVLQDIPMSLDFETIGVLSWSFSLLAGLHALALIQTLYRSFQARRLSLDSSSVVTWLLSPVSSHFNLPKWTASYVQDHRSKPPVFNHLNNHRPSTFQRVAVISRRRLTTVNQGLQHVFSIEGEYFEDSFLIRECLEVAAQIYQAHQMNLFIATRWINNVFVGMLVINCFSTPLIHWFMPAAKVTEAKKRLVVVLLNAFLDFINSVVLPLVIFMKYVRWYDPLTHDFPVDLLFDDVWWVSTIYELHQLCITSLMDFVSTMLPFLSLFHCLMVCQHIVSRGQVHNAMLWISGHENGCHPQSSSPTTASCSMSSRRRYFHMLLRAMLCLTGIVVLVLQIDAQTIGNIVGCKLQATPWLHGRKSSCVVLNINCYRQKMHGNVSELESVLTRVNTQTLLTVIISHCPALRIPSIIREFHQLNGIEIYNSSLQEWSMASAPRDQDFPLLTYLYFVRSNFTKCVPDALWLQPLPSMVNQIVFYETKLPVLPPQVHTSWTKLHNILVEFSRVEETQLQVLADLPHWRMYLTGNPIHELTLDLFANQDLLDLHLSNMPLTQLPAQTSGDLAQLQTLFLESTQLQDVPSYIQQWYHRSIEAGNPVIHSLFGSPFCDRLIRQNEPEYDYQQQVCTKDWGSTQGWYPIDVVVPQRSV